jgi:ABC-type transporter Mla subunit MlaD
MADSDARSDPFNDVITLLAAPLAGGLRSYEQFRRGIDELFRTIENLNTTMENLNESAARVNRLMADIEEPIRAMIPQLTRTIRTADEVVTTFGSPAMRAAPNISRVVETLSSPAFVTLPNRIEEFSNVISETSRRLGPLTQLLDSAGGLFGIKIPGMPSSSSAVSRNADQPSAVKSPQPAKKATARKSTAQKSTAQKSSARKSSAKKAAPKK